jgi:hypothetical protein
MIRLLRPALGMCLLAGLASGQGTQTKEKPSDYPVHVQLPNLEMAAEYLVHSMPAPGGAIFVKEFLVIEVAVFPARGSDPVLNSGQFTLRMNGKKSVEYPQSPGLVAGTLKYPDWSRHTNVIAEAGAGNGSVIVGADPPVERFPGDPTVYRRPLPRAPDETNPTAQNQEPSMSIDELVQRLALPEGTAHGPVSGYLFFPFQGKLKSVRSLDLLYKNPQGGETVLTLITR